MTSQRLDPYLDLIEELPLPTAEQTAAFVDYVVDAHSWYKHLSPLPPGARFVFFLNPNVARNRLRTAGGEVAFVDRTEGDGSKFHYTWMTTAEYRGFFGYWDYHCAAAPQFLLLAKRQVTDLRSQIRVLDRGGEWILPSEELVEVGSCRLTAFVHELLNPMVWGRRHQDAEKAFGMLPAGDPDVLRYRPLLDAIAWWKRDAPLSKPAYEELKRFHESERALQRARIAAALEQGLALMARER